MNTRMGTPKTLLEAIERDMPLAKPHSESALAILIERNVVDFLRQRFTVAYLFASNNPTTLFALETLAKELGVVDPEDDHDPTPYCSWCGAMSHKNCDCGPRAEND